MQSNEDVTHESYFREPVQPVVVTEKKSTSPWFWVALILAAIVFGPSLLDDMTATSSTGDSVSASQVISYELNQDVYDELLIYNEQYDNSLESNREARDNFNDAIDAYNNYIHMYNDMSYFQQTSSSTVNKMNTLKSNVHATARTFLISSEVMESQTDDILMFLEVNKKVLMDMNSKNYLELKNNMIENKAIFKNGKSVANEALYI